MASIPFSIAGVPLLWIQPLFVNSVHTKHPFDKVFASCFGQAPPVRMRSAGPPDAGATDPPAVSRDRPARCGEYYRLTYLILSVEINGLSGHAHLLWGAA